MQIRCIRDFSQYVPGDVETVPDGAAFDDFHWEAVTVPPAPDPAASDDPPADPPAAPAAQFPQPVPKEM